MISSTSTSGAEAPAVMPTLRMPMNSFQSISPRSAPAWRGGSLRALPLRRGAPNWSYWASRPRSAGRMRSRSASPRPGGWWWRSRCRPCAGRRCAESSPATPPRWRGCRQRRAWSAWCRRARPRLLGVKRCASAMVSMRCTEPSGNCPMVPSTSGWPAWPMSSTSRPAGVMALRLDMDLGDERAGGVEIEEIAPRMPRPEPISAPHERRR